MALVVNDRVKETSTTIGTGTLTLAGAVPGFETFSSAIGDTNTTYYSIVNENGEFEVGLGTVGAGTLARTTPISSSNSDALVDFSAGTKNVFCTLPASKAVILDSSGNIVANNGSNLTNLNADNLASGTLPDARFPATLPASNGSALTNLNASNVASGTLASDRLPTVPTTKGGTGLTTIGTANQVIAVNAGATALEYQTVDLANLNADNLTSGTVPDARFPATLPAISGANLTNLDADDLASGTLPDARFPATLPAASGANLTSLNATNIASGTLASDRLPTVPTTKGGTGLTAIGTANQVLAVNSGATALEYQTIDLTNLNASNLSSGTVPDARFPATLPAISGANLTNLDASDLASGTVPDARFPATLPAISGANLTNLDASDLASGTVPIARIDLDLLTTSTSDGDGDFFVVVDSAGAEKKLTKANINISGFNNNSGFTTNTGTVTSVTGGNGLTGSVTTSGSLDVGAGTLIDVTADAVNVDLSELTTSTSDGDGDFFCVVDSGNAQKKLTKGNINLSGFNNDSNFTNKGTATVLSMIFS